jgi:carboxymethylenebutenolidase
MPEITVQAADGGRFSAYVAVPKQAPAPTILVIQEIFGVNQVMRDTCDWLAGEGYLACCPDLFWRIEPNIQITDKSEAEWQRAFELFSAFDVDKGVEDLKATLAALRGHKDSNGKVGSVGYCLGGKLAFLMATRSDSDCNVGYYGVGLDGLLDEVANIKKPLLMHMAAKDQFVPPEAQAKIKPAFAASPNITLHVYDEQDHAFAREGGQHYDEQAASRANQRSLAFFAEHLG